MKYLKTKNISKFSIKDNSLIYNTYGRVTIDSSNALRLPRGTTAQRPDEISIPLLNGSIRYNTDTNSLEALIDGVWEIVRAPGASSILKSEIGIGDYTETVFGPLPQVPSSVNNILVFVENVFQISTTNFTLEQSVSGNLTGPNAPYADGWYLKFTSPVPLDKPVTVYFGFAN
jgi:hypothetical protein